MHIRSEWRGSPPALRSTIEVTERAGCDEAPLDPRSDADRQSLLLAYCWPEQRERVERLRAALELAATDKLAVDRAAAQGFAPVDWIYQSWAYDAHDVGSSPGFAGDTAQALAAIRAPTLVLAPPLDLYNPVEAAR